MFTNSRYNPIMAYDSTMAVANDPATTGMPTTLGLVQYSFTGPQSNILYYVPVHPGLVSLFGTVPGNFPGNLPDNVPVAVPVAVPGVTPAVAPGSTANATPAAPRGATDAITAPANTIKKRGRPKGSKNRTSAPTAPQKANGGEEEGETHWVWFNGYCNIEGDEDCPGWRRVPKKVAPGRATAPKGKRKMQREIKKEREQRKIAGFPKKAKNAYFLFRENVYAKCVAQGEKNPATRDIGNLYSLLSEEEKETYTTSAKVCQGEYEKAVEKFYAENPQYRKSEESVDI